MLTQFMKFMLIVVLKELFSWELLIFHIWVLTLLIMRLGLIKILFLKLKFCWRKDLRFYITTCF